MLAADSVDLLHLAGAEAFGGIEAPDAFISPCRRRISWQPAMQP